MFRAITDFILQTNSFGFVLYTEITVLMSVSGRIQTRLEHSSLPQFTLHCLCNRSTVITAFYIRKLECRGINLSSVSSNSLLLTLSWRDLSKCDLSEMGCHVFNEFCSRRINQMVIDSDWCRRSKKCKRYRFVHSSYKYLFSLTKCPGCAQFCACGVKWEAIL